MSEATFLRWPEVEKRMEDSCKKSHTVCVGKCSNELVRDVERIIILAWWMVRAGDGVAGWILDALCKSGLVWWRRHVVGREQAGYSSSVNPIYFVPGDREVRAKRESPFGAPNGDATGDLWTTCRCYSPINSPCLPDPPTRYLSLWSLRLVFRCLLTHHHDFSS